MARWRHHNAALLQCLLESALRWHGVWFCPLLHTGREIPFDATSSDNLHHNFLALLRCHKIHQTVRRSSVVENAERVVALGLKCRRISIMVLNFAYFPIVAATISSLTPCESDSGISFLPHIPWVDCPSGTHTKLVCMGWVSLLLYVVGVPYFIFLPTLFRNRAVINESDSREHKKLEWLGPLYTTYSESCKCMRSLTRPRISQWDAYDVVHWANHRFPERRLDLSTTSYGLQTLAGERAFWRARAKVKEQATHGESILSGDSSLVFLGIYLPEGERYIGVLVCLWFSL